MTSKTLGNLTDATALTGTEQVYVVQSSNSRKSTAQAIADLGTSQDNMSDGTTNKNYTATEQTKLAGIATGATANTGTVTSAALSVPTGLSVSGSPITTSGTFAITYASGYEGFTTALKTLVNSAVQPTDVREVLTANRTYYVATTGSDSNDGLTSGTAFLTIQKAVNVALALDMSIYSVTISVGAGTFTEGTYLGITGNGNARITIVGAGYSSTTISGSTFGLYVLYGVSLTLQDLDIASAGSAAINARFGSLVFFAGSIRFSGGTVRHINVDHGSYVESTAATLYLNSDSVRFAMIGVGGGAYLGGPSTVIKTTSARAFTQFAYASGAGAELDFGGCSFDVTAGAITGQRYLASLNAVINTSGGGASFLPGSTAGAVATGGQYA